MSNTKHIHHFQHFQEFQKKPKYERLVTDFAQGSVQSRNQQSSLGAYNYYSQSFEHRNQSSFYEDDRHIRRNKDYNSRIEHLKKNSYQS